MSLLCPLRALVLRARLSREFLIAAAVPTRTMFRGFELRSLDNEEKRNTVITKGESSVLVVISARWFGSIRKVKLARSFSREEFQDFSKNEADSPFSWVKQRERVFFWVKTW